jgi:hypothetical protein
MHMLSEKYHYHATGTVLGEFHQVLGTAIDISAISDCTYGEYETLRMNLLL